MLKINYLYAKPNAQNYCNVFKNSIQKFIPEPNQIFINHNTEGLKLLRTKGDGLNHLADHKF